MADTGAGERTEKPSGKRIKDAREKGQVARSRDLTAAVSLASVTLAISWFGVQMVSAVSTRLAGGLNTLADHAHENIEATTIASQLVADAGILVRVAGPPAAIAGTIAILAGLAQVGWMLS